LDVAREFHDFVFTDGLENFVELGRSTIGKDKTVKSNFLIVAVVHAALFFAGWNCRSDEASGADRSLTKFIGAEAIKFNVCAGAVLHSVDWIDKGKVIGQPIKCGTIIKKVTLSATGSKNGG